MTPLDGVSDADLSTIIAYLDGELEADEMIRFELRMSEEPALARAFESFAHTDVLERASRHGSEETGKTVRMWPRVLIAAAAIIVALVTLLIWRSSSDEVEFLVAAFPSGVSMSRYNEYLGLSPDQHPDVHRGGDTEVPVTPDEYFQLVKEAEQVAFESVLQSQGKELRATSGYFILPFRASAEVSAIVAIVSDAGKAELVFPSQDYPAANENRYAPFEIHVLPRKNVTLDSGGAIDWAMGFLIPVHCHEWRVLFALREEEVEPRLLAGFESFLGSLVTPDPATESQSLGTAETIRDWLVLEGFQVDLLTITVP